MNLLEKLNFHDDKPAMVVMKNTDKQQILLFGLKKGQVLKRHTTPIPAVLFVLKGSVEFDMDGKFTTLGECGSIDIPVDVPHEVTGNEDESVFIVVKEKV